MLATSCDSEVCFISATFDEMWQSLSDVNDNGTKCNMEIVPRTTTKGNCSFSRGSQIVRRYEQTRDYLFLNETESHEALAEISFPPSLLSAPFSFYAGAGSMLEIDCTKLFP